MDLSSGKAPCCLAPGPWEASGSARSLARAAQVALLHWRGTCRCERLEPGGLRTPPFLLVGRFCSSDPKWPWPMRGTTGSCAGSPHGPGTGESPGVGAAGAWGCVARSRVTRSWCPGFRPVVPELRLCTISGDSQSSELTPGATGLGVSLQQPRDSGLPGWPMGWGSVVEGPGCGAWPRGHP